MIDFAKTFRLNDGTQALAYLEFDGDSVICHIVLQFESFQADIKYEKNADRFTDELRKKFLDELTDEKLSEMKMEIAKEYSLS